jgi:ribosomal protein L11 methyltransferase
VTSANSNPAGWRQFVMNLGTLDATAVEAIFLRHGALSVTFTDAADEPLLEPAPGATPLWSKTRISALFATETDLQSLPNDLQRTFELREEPQYQIETLPEKVWEREWLKDFRPMQFGPRLWICPGDQTIEATDAVVVHIDPGLAFGSGTHPTTAMCLTWLDQQNLAGADVLDFGCGSGILSVAALCLGAKSAQALDIDPQAIVASRENARKNNVRERLTSTLDADAIFGPFDVVVANILAGPLAELAPQICGHLHNGGLLALSGILADQADDLIAAYEPWIEFEPTAHTDEWICLSGKKR